MVQTASMDLMARQGLLGQQVDQLGASHIFSWGDMLIGSHIFQMLGLSRFDTANIDATCECRSGRRHRPPGSHRTHRCAIRLNRTAVFAECQHQGCGCTAKLHTASWKKDLVDVM